MRLRRRVLLLILLWNDYSRRLLNLALGTRWARPHVDRVHLEVLLIYVVLPLLLHLVLHDPQLGQALLHRELPLHVRGVVLYRLEGRSGSLEVALVEHDA